ncbi:unnamed protein product [Tuber aestivum]|uniref:AB hydrolase-1 domain-containing protein n=1 Tax=Tuber aestivum TaxID=59557 RepID=A0A292PK23_9PEZI|nr:unnamed protein product [Tuber aestivum]
MPAPTPTPLPFPLPTNLPPLETLYFPTPNPNPAQPYILFIPGNPGLVGYYVAYLSALSALAKLPILALSHSGFCPGQACAKPTPPGYWGLRDQVRHKAEIIRWLAEEKGWDKVLLMGHSVGGYVFMEVIRELGGEGEKVEVVGGVGLFPTIVDIGKSPSGRLLTSILSYVPPLPSIAATAARALTLLPAPVLDTILKAVTRQPPSAASVTGTFLTAPGMVFQALELAREEVETITEDAWGEEIWGCDDTPLVFYFGRNVTTSRSLHEGGTDADSIQDHWVAEETREKLLEARGTGVRMVVCEDGLPHGFCISHGEIMAEKAAAWVNEMAAKGNPGGSLGEGPHRTGP